MYGIPFQVPVIRISHDFYGKLNLFFAMLIITPSVRTSFSIPHFTYYWLKNFIFSKNFFLFLNFSLRYIIPSRNQYSRQFLFTTYKILDILHMTVFRFARSIGFLQIEDCDYALKNFICLMFNVIINYAFLKSYW